VTPVFRAAATPGMQAAGIGVPVSHVNDAKRLAEYKRLLGEPCSLARSAQMALSSAGSEGFGD
jgi:hypothetical protein